MKKKETEVTTLRRPIEMVGQDNSAEALISQAIANKVDVGTMERLLAMRTQFKVEYAREAYVKAVSIFQSECPVIKKTKKVLNKDGKSVRYMFAPLDSIVEQIKQPLAKATLSYRWETKKEGDEIRAICIVTHSLGHSESSDFSVPIDKEGYMSAPQKFASALTFAKRYSLCNALGISTGDEDTDAVDVGKEPDVKSLKSKVMFLLRTLGENTTDKNVMEVEILRLTGFKLEEANLKEIIKKLEVKVLESTHEDKTIR